MPPRGSSATGGRGARGGGRGGRGRGAARGAISSVESATPQVEADTQPTQIPSQAPPPADGGDASMQDAPSNPSPAQSPAVSIPSSARQSMTPSATSSRATGRFRPKNVRRDAAERARLEEERNRDLAMKIKEEEKELRAEERRAQRGRGRGRGDRGQRGFMRRTVMASGPFSSIDQTNVKGVGRGSGGGGGRGGEGGSSSKAHFPPDFNSSRYRPRRDHEERVNIDLLNELDPSNEDETSRQPSRFSQKSFGSLPVGLPRTLHEDDEVKVKTTAELEAEERQSSDDEDMFISRAAKDLLHIGSDQDGDSWHAAPRSEGGVKDEPGTGSDMMDIDMADIPEAVKQPSSPEVKKATISNEDSVAIAQQRRKEKAAKDPEILQTVYDLEAQLQELSFRPRAETEEEGNTDKADKAQEKDDVMYLFQLPPILPPLVNPFEELAEEVGQNGNSNTRNKMKTEDGAEKEKKAYNPFGTLPPEGGLIGKLNVRQSGKIEMDWGGTPMTIGMGADTGYQMSAMVIEQNIDLQNPEASTGTAYGMGDVVRKFVVVPVWDEEEDWDPSLDGIDGLDE